MFDKPRFVCALLSLFALFVFHASSFAAEDEDENTVERVFASPELDRKLASNLKSGQYEVWIKEEWLETRLDLLGYKNSTGAVGNYNSTSLGLRHAFWDDLNISTTLALSSLSGTNSSGTMSLAENYYFLDLSLQYLLLNDDETRLSIEGGYRTHRGAPTKISTYTVGSTTLSGLNGAPILTIYASDESFPLALRVAKSAWDVVEFGGGLEARMGTANVHLNSPLEYDPTLNTQFQSIAGNYGSWRENDYILNAYVNFALSSRTSMALEGTLYRVQRSDYKSSGAHAELTSNSRYDLYVFWRPFEESSLFLNFRYYENFLLGDSPLLYNESSYKFFRPVGFVTLGGTINF